MEYGEAFNAALGVLTGTDLSITGNSAIGTIANDDVVGVSVGDVEVV